MTVKFYWHPDYMWAVLKCKGARIGYLSINIGRMEIVVFHPWLTKWILQKPTPPQNVREK